MNLHEQIAHGFLSDCAFDVFYMNADDTDKVAQADLSRFGILTDPGWTGFNRAEHYLEPIIKARE